MRQFQTKVALLFFYVFLIMFSLVQCHSSSSNDDSLDTAINSATTDPEQSGSETEETTDESLQTESESNSEKTDGAEATSGSIPQYVVYSPLVIHAGEGGDSKCSFENFQSFSIDEIQRYQYCRDGLIEVAQELAKLGIKASFQFHGAFLELLLQDEEKRGGFHLKNHLIDLGHEIGIHHHSQCREVLDSRQDYCKTKFSLESWGTVTDVTQKSVELLANSHFLVVTEAQDGLGEFKGTNSLATDSGIIVHSYCGHHVTDQINKDLAASEVTMVDFILSKGVTVLTSSNEFDISWNTSESSCHNGSSTVDDDKFKQLPHPLKLPGTSGELYYYDVRGSLIGDPSYDLESDKEFIKRHFDCIQQRLANSSYHGEVLYIGNTTHLHNMLNDEDGNGTWDGVDHMKSFLLYVQELVEANENLSYVEFTTLSTLDAVRKSSMDLGANYSFDITPRVE